MNKDKLQNYLKEINSDISKNDNLIYNKKYKLWRDGKYLGIATWTEDNEIGDSFQVGKLFHNKIFVKEVYIVDKWELITES